MVTGTDPLCRLASPGCRVSHLACLCSLTAHGVLAVLLALHILPQGAATGPGPIESAVTAVAAETVRLDSPLLPTEQRASNAAAISELIPIEAAPAALSLSAQPVAISEQLPVDQAERPTELNRPVAATVGSQPGTEGTATGSGSGSGTGKGFFGLQELGRKTVFVVDASSSMNFRHPPPAGTRFRRVQLELLKTIAEMQPQQEFFIIFFSDQAMPMPADRMMAATPSAQQTYLHWMVNVQAQGRTRPLQAMLQALQLQPDTIYFLTDGAYPIKINDAITKANERRVTIQTIGFGDDSGAEVLTDLAVRNYGSYRFIPAGN